MNSRPGQEFRKQSTLGKGKFYTYAKLSQNHNVIQKANGQKFRLVTGRKQEQDLKQVCMNSNQHYIHYNQH